MSELKNILNQYGFKFKRQLGQNFISDTNLLNSVVNDSHIDKDSTVLEIGAGAGTLTRAIAMAAKRVISYEIDDNLIPVLTDYLKDYSNVTIVNKDIMKVSDSEISEITSGKFKVIANLPYYITSPVIMRFIESELDVSSITVMIQKEVAERLVAKPNTSEYGAITVAVQIVADVTITRNVTRKLFYPEPNVDSAVVRIDIRRDKFNIDNMSLLKRLIRSAFAMRRKTLINNLMVSFNLTREQCADALKQCGLDDKVRGEVLSPEKFVELSKVIGGIL